MGDADIAFDELSQSCRLLFGEQTQRALNRYTTAENQWSKCLRDLKCESKPMERKLQKQWAVENLP